MNVYTWFPNKIYYARIFDLFSDMSDVFSTHWTCIGCIRPGQGHERTITMDKEVNPDYVIGAQSTLVQMP